MFQFFKSYDEDFVGTPEPTNGKLQEPQIINDRRNLYYRDGSSQLVLTLQGSSHCHGNSTQLLQQRNTSDPTGIRDRTHNTVCSVHTDRQILRSPTTSRSFFEVKYSKSKIQLLLSFQANVVVFDLKIGVA